MMQAMIFAAGLGTRLKPITDTKPKALVEVGGMSLLRRVIMNLKHAGAERIIVNVHHFADQIISYLEENDNFGVDICVSDETNMLLDTGGAVKKAASLLMPNAPLLIHNVDIISNVDMQEFYKKALSHDATLLVSNRKTSRHLLFDDNMRLVGWENSLTGEVRSPFKSLEIGNCRKLAFSGIHVLSPKLIAAMSSFPDKFGIVNFYLKVCAANNIFGLYDDNLKLIDVGKADTLAVAEDFIEKLCN